MSRALNLARSNISALIVGAAAISLAILPVPLCFDCEYPNAWGQPDAIGQRNLIVLAIWLLAAPFLAALTGTRRAWIIPLGIALADVFTQHLGGVPWAFVVQENAALCLLLTIPLGFCSLFLGFLAHLMVLHFTKAKAI